LVQRKKVTAIRHDILTGKAQDGYFIIERNLFPIQRSPLRIYIGNGWRNSRQSDKTIHTGSKEKISNYRQNEQYKKDQVFFHGKLKY
jgi:hypothetical protein